MAGWREALLAQAVLSERTKGYRHHPQLQRFRQQSWPLEAIGAYLQGMHEEASKRGYRFDGSKILALPNSVLKIPVTQGQLDYEWVHLGEKLKKRSPEGAQRWKMSAPSPHPLFDVVSGEIEPWERA